MIDKKQFRIFQIIDCMMHDAQLRPNYTKSKNNNRKNKILK